MKAMSTQSTVLFVWAVDNELIYSPVA